MTDEDRDLMREIAGWLRSVERLLVEGHLLDVADRANEYASRLEEAAAKPAKKSRPTAKDGAKIIDLMEALKESLRKEATPEPRP